METLIAKQKQDRDAMSRAFLIFKSKGDQNSKEQIETNITGLEEKWSAIEKRHEEIVKLKTPANENISYFKEKLFEEAEEVYLDEKGKFLDALYAIRETKIVCPTSNHQFNYMYGPISMWCELPPIELPRFTGKYSDWLSFKNLFTALVANNEALTNVERLCYLKTCLSGDAANLIQNLAITAENYNYAWTELTSRYDNKRILINVCLDEFFSIDPVKTESHSDLKKFWRETLKAIETLKMLGSPVQHMDDLLVFFTMRRVDYKTRYDWEFSLGNSTSPPTWMQLVLFMNTRIRVLDYCAAHTTE